MKAIKSWDKYQLSVLLIIQLLGKIFDLDLDGDDDDIMD